MALENKTLVGSPTASQAVAYTSSAGNSTAVGAGARLVRLVATTDCFFKIGTAVVATTSHEFLPLGVVEYRLIGNGERVSAIRSSADGTLYVSEFPG